MLHVEISKPQKDENLVKELSVKSTNLKKYQDISKYISHPF